MATIAIDSLQDTAGTLLSAHTACTSGTHTAGLTWATTTWSTTGTVQIRTTTGGIRNTTKNQNPAYNASPTPGNADQTVDVEHVLPTNHTYAAGDFANGWGRGLIGATQTRYAAQWAGTGTGAALSFTLRKIVGGTNTNLATFNWTFSSFPATFWVRLTCLGTTIRMVVAATQGGAALGGTADSGNVTDSAISAAGNVGIQEEVANVSTADDTAAQYILHFEASDTTSGGTTFNITATGTQAQSLSLAKTVNLTRTLTQAQTATASKISAFVKTLSATQAQSLSLKRAVALIRAVTQAQTATASKLSAFVKTVTLTQAQVASAVATKVKLVTVTATQAQSLAITRSVRLTRALTQAQSLALVKRINLTRAVSQATSAVASFVYTPGTAVYHLTVSATQAQVASFVAIFHAFSRGNGSFSNPEVVIDSVDGYSAAAVTSGQYLIESVFAYPARIGGVQVHADTAGTGTGSTTVDVLLNGSSIYHTASDRPTLAVGGTGAFTQANPPADTAVNRGDRLAIQVVTVPTTAGHARVKAQVAIERPLRRGV